MPSRVFNTIIQKAAKGQGGRGIKSAPTRVLRVPENHLEELDNLLQDYKQRSLENPKSPRYHFLDRFISELEDILTGAED